MARDQAEARRTRLFELMEDLERALERLDWWEPAPPPAWRLQSEQPFSIDTLSFPQWLQWQFIPRMRSVLRARAPLPSKSAIYPYAELWVEDAKEDTSELLEIIAEVDAAISASAGESMH